MLRTGKAKWLLLGQQRAAEEDRGPSVVCISKLAVLASPCLGLLDYKLNFQQVFQPGTFLSICDISQGSPVAAFLDVIFFLEPY